MKEIPCKKCPVLAVCVSKDYVDCDILNKAVAHGFPSFHEIKSIRIFLRKEKSYRADGGRLQLFNERYYENHTI